MELGPLSDGGVVLRSTHRPWVSITLDAAEWADFLDTVKAGDFDTF